MKIHMAFFYLILSVLISSCKMQLGDTSGTGEASLDGVPRSAHRIFLSSESLRGDFALGGNAHTIADAKCLELAQDAGLERNYVAVLSMSVDNTTNPPTSRDALDKITISGDVYVVDNNNNALLVAESAQDFWSASNSNRLINPISYDETGQEINNARPWTGTGANGAAVGGSLCDDWQSTNGSGQVGASGIIDDRWIENTTLACSEPHYIYCISQ